MDKVEHGINRYDEEWVTLKMTQEQKEKVKHFFEQNNWDFTEKTVASQTLDDGDDDFDPSDCGPEGVIKQDESQDECPHCLCRPCITNEQNRQEWWVNQQPAHILNSVSRKGCYKNFWTMLYHRRVWVDPRYKARKCRALGLDPDQNRLQWIHQRDIMPNCVLDLVRDWLPNPKGIPYMGHRWE